MPVPIDWAERFDTFIRKFKENSGAEEYLGEQPFPNFVLTEPEPATSWEDFLRWVNELDGTWCFRGHRESRWLLATSLDRAARRDIKETHKGRHVTGYYHLDRDAEAEKYFRQFRDEANRYTSKAPSDDDSGSWFALMQHYGTPTRFLDWTSSPYVAAYFALEKEAQEDEKRSAIWAIDLDWLEKRALEILRGKGWSSPGNDAQVRARWENKLLDECHEAVVIKMNPLEANERMTAQQGILLCKLIHEAYFFAVLMRMMIYPETVRQPVVRKIEIDTRHRTQFLEKLRAMNIHRASLFPRGDQVETLHSAVRRSA
jgi:FRG domain